MKWGIDLPVKMRDLTGERFTRLTVTHQVLEKGRKYQSVICDCGEIKKVQGSDLTNGKVKSCGCLNTENRIKHGMCGTRLFNIWNGMKKRCASDKESVRVYYKDKGIKVCDRWLSFSNFYEDMNKSYQESVLTNGEYDTTLDRIDSNGDYSIDNVRWATKKQQIENRGMQVNNTSGIKNVSYHKPSNKWIATAYENGKSIYLGIFKTKEEAAKAVEIKREKGKL